MCKFSICHLLIELIKVAIDAFRAGYCEDVLECISCDLILLFTSLGTEPGSKKIGTEGLCSQKENKLRLYSNNEGRCVELTQNIFHFVDIS